MGRAALRVKIRLNEAEPEGCGGSTVEGENEVWPDLRRNPSGRANFPHFVVARRLDTLGICLSSILKLRKNWLPARPTP
jgi:hypothetical protein